MPTERSDQIWNQLLEAGNFERHFNQLQASYRALASTWLLATFAGIGFVVVNQKGIPFDWPVAVSGICLLGALGIGLLWALDLLVYHRLLDAFFFTARRIELGHAEQPPYRLNLYNIVKDQGVVSTVILFYLCGVGVLILLATLAAGYELAKHDLPWPSAIAGLVFIVGIPWLMRYKTTNGARKVRRFFKLPR
jgi:hypothetical protein